MGTVIRAAALGIVIGTLLGAAVGILLILVTGVFGVPAWCLAALAFIASGVLIRVDIACMRARERRVRDFERAEERRRSQWVEGRDARWKP